MQVDAGSVQVEAQVASFIGKFAEPMQVMIQDCRARLEKRLPQAVELIYDNYNFFVIGFGPTTRSSDSILSLACCKNGSTCAFCNARRNCPIRQASCEVAAGSCGTWR